MTDLKTLQAKISQEIKADYDSWRSRQQAEEQETTIARETKKKLADTHFKGLRPEDKKYEAYTKELVAVTEKQVADIRAKYMNAAQGIQIFDTGSSDPSVNMLSDAAQGQLALPSTFMLIGGEDDSQSAGVSAQLAIVYNNSTLKPWAKGWGGGWGCFNSGIGSVAQWAEFGFWFRPSQTRFHTLYALNVLRGFYLTIASDEWYDCKHARVDIDVFTDVWQYNWKGAQQHHLFDRAGDNINVNSRFDQNRWTPHTALLAAGDWAYLRVSVRLNVYARGGGSYAELNFNAGAANYIQCPYCYIY